MMCIIYLMGGFLCYLECAWDMGALMGGMIWLGLDDTNRRFLGFFQFQFLEAFLIQRLFRFKRNFSCKACIPCLL